MFQLEIRVYELYYVSRLMEPQANAWLSHLRHDLILNKFTWNFSHPITYSEPQLQGSLFSQPWKIKRAWEDDVHPATVPTANLRVWNCLFKPSLIHVLKLHVLNERWDKCVFLHLFYEGEEGKGSQPSWVHRRGCPEPARFGTPIPIYSWPFGNFSFCGILPTELSADKKVKTAFLSSRNSRTRGRTLAGGRSQHSQAGSEEEKRVWGCAGDKSPGKSEACHIRLRVRALAQGSLSHQIGSLKIKKEWSVPRRRSKNFPGRGNGRAEAREAWRSRGCWRTQAVSHAQAALQRKRQCKEVRRHGQSSPWRGTERMLLGIQRTSSTDDGHLQSPHSCSPQSFLLQRSPGFTVVHWLEKRKICNRDINGSSYWYHQGPRAVAKPGRDSGVKSAEWGNEY